MTITQYREAIKRLLDKVGEIKARHTAENREPTEAEVALKTKLLDEVESLRERLQVEEREERIRKDLDAPANPPLSRPAPTQTQASEDRPKDRFASLGEQMYAVANAVPERSGRVDPRLYRAATGLGEVVTSDGGFLLQPNFSAELLEQTFATGVLASRCRSVPISGNSNSIKINGVDETSRASTRYGGVLGYWVGEGEEKTASKPKFRQVTLELKKLIGLCYATDELLQDSVALEAFIRRAFPGEFGFKLDDAIVNGSGSGQPLGFLNSGCLVTVSKEAGQTAATILAENVIKMYSRMFAGSLNSAVWLVNQNTLPQLYMMSMAVGTGGAPVFMPAGGLSGNPFNTILGRPVIPIEQAATLGTIGDIMFVDLNGYLLAQKGGLQSDMSIHVRFIYDESVFRFVLRVDGQPERATALTPYKGGSGSTQSHFVALETRS